jgi:deoxyhypusine synthase
MDQTNTPNGGPNKGSSAHDAVFVASSALPDTAVPVKGYDFSLGPPDLNALLESYFTTGFQATSMALAINEINAMLKWRLSDEPVLPDEPEKYLDPEVRRQTRTTIFLSYTSNLVSAGLRESFRFLAQNSLVNCIVTTAGGVEEDLIKCLAPTYLLSAPAETNSEAGEPTPAASSSAWEIPGSLLRSHGLNRIGNLVVPNSNYGKFEDWVMPILDAMLEEQKRDGIIWTPSTMIARLGKEIGDESSIAYWAYKVRPKN